MASTGDIWYPPPLHPVTKLYSILPCWVEGVEIDDGSKSFHTYMSIYNSAHSYPHIQRVEKLPRENRKKEEGVGRRRLYLTLVTSVYTGLGQSLKNLEPFVQDDSVNANCDRHLANCERIVMDVSNFRHKRYFSKDQLSYAHWLYRGDYTFDGPDCTGSKWFSGPKWNIFRPYS